MRYTPPEAPEIPDLITQWQAFIYNDEDGLDPLVTCALQHYQFEAIHAFSDGNGRAGRILIVLHLVHAGLLELPILYMSGYINRNRAAYYELLLGVSRDGAWERWVLFMLDALGEQLFSYPVVTPVNLSRRPVNPQGSEDLIAREWKGAQGLAAQANSR